MHKHLLDYRNEFLLFNGSDAFTLREIIDQQLFCQWSWQNNFSLILWKYIFFNLRAFQQFFFFDSWCLNQRKICHISECSWNKQNQGNLQVSYDRLICLFLSRIASAIRAFLSNGKIYLVVIIIFCCRLDSCGCINAYVPCVLPSHNFFTYYCHLYFNKQFLGWAIPRC